MTPNRRWMLVLAAVFAIALAPRIVIALKFDQPPTMNNDAGWYDFFGEQISEGKGYTLPYGEPTATWPPGYPFFLAGVYKATGESRDAARIAQALLGALTAVLTAELGRRLLGSATGAAAGLVMALTPSHALYTSILMSEVLFTALIAGALVVGVRARSSAAAAATGVLFGAATLVRPQGLLLLTAIAASWIAFGFLRRADRRQLAMLGVTIAAALLTVAPWTLRNARELDAFVPVSTNLGLNLWIGNNPDADGSFEIRNVGAFEDEVAGRERPELEVRYDGAARSAALRYIRRHPLEAISRAPDKIYETYRNDASAPHWYEPTGADYLTDNAASRIRRASNWSYYALLIAAGGGTVLLLLRREPSVVLPVAGIVVWTGVSVVFFGEPRFHIPVLPLFAILAGAALAEGVAFVTSPRRAGHASP